MTLALVPLPAERFERWLERSTHEYLRDLIATGQPGPQAESAARQTMQQAFEGRGPRGTNAVFDVVDNELGIVGYLWVGTDASDDPSSWWIWDFLIEDEFRGRGFGKSAMLLAENYARSQGAATLGLNVFGFNTTARRLYESVGYETTSLKMRKTL